MTEADWRNDQSSKVEGDSWPREGKIEFKNYSTRYRYICNCTHR